jgi:hypothetical protein
MTIENCDVHDVDSEGVFVGSNQRPPTLTATVKGNMIAAGGALGYSIFDEAAGSITNNIIANGAISAGNAVSNAVLSNSIGVKPSPSRRFLLERRIATITHTNATKRASATAKKVFPRAAYVWWDSL